MAAMVGAPLAVAAAAAAPGARVFLARPLLRRSPRGVACALRRRPSKYKNKIQNEEVVAEDDIGGGGEDDDDALEALFKQLEEDLKNDDLSVEDDDDGISEEDMARFEQELAEAIGDIADADESAEGSSLGSEAYGNDEKTDEIKRPELKNWQLKRLARALKIGRRKTSIKNLAGELGLDRTLVIELLRNPPPKLLFMSDSLPDEDPSKPEIKEIEPSPVVDNADVTETKPHTELPVHVMCAEWSSQKRLKKVQLETLERVYSRTKRPTNTMISSIVQVTSLPRKTIVKWFEDRREQDGVPDHRVAFKRSLSETIAS
ncbi:protein OVEREXPRESSOR OF CATIONIC PEROXIDASE 3 [Oryza glaberrima]|uniref:Homeobox domain-containing protein n=1 Tax=Oryza glumipatula TaxID=40148 RepID=A0A0E0ABJ5_9ORYZ|nr:protein OVEREXPRESSOR OF CATIONIC PEROXIDASE 3 [Oryza glaberrima]